MLWWVGANWEALPLHKPLDRLRFNYWLAQVRGEKGGMLGGFVGVSIPGQIGLCQDTSPSLA